MNHNLIHIFGPPRSGTSWLGQIFNSSPQTIYTYQPFFNYGKNVENLDEAFLNKNLDSLLTHTIKHKDFFRQTGASVFETSYDCIRFLDFNKLNPKSIVMKHVRYQYLMEYFIKRDMKVVAIIRNPLATINSWLNCPRECLPEWNKLEEWRHANKKNDNKKHEYNGFEKWKELARTYLSLQSLYPKNFKLIKYENLLNIDECCSHIKDTFKFCNLEFTDQTKNFITLSRHKNGTSKYSIFRKKETDNLWENELHPQIKKEIIQDLENSPLEEFIKC